MPALTILGPADFSLTANPSTITTTPNGVVSVNVLVTGTQGYNGQGVITPSGLPVGATVFPASQTVTGSGSATFVITTTNSPISGYPIRITPNGNAKKGVTAYLTISAPTPAVMLSRTPGSNLQNSANTFVWVAPVGATQVQCLVGSSAGGSDVFSFAASATASVNCPDGRVAALATQQR